MTFDYEYVNFYHLSFDAEEMSHQDSNLSWKMNFQAAWGDTSVRQIYFQFLQSAWKPSQNFLIPPHFKLTHYRSNFPLLSFHFLVDY